MSEGKTESDDPSGSEAEGRVPRAHRDLPYARGQRRIEHFLERCATPRKAEVDESGRPTSGVASESDRLNRRRAIRHLAQLREEGATMPGDGTALRRNLAGVDRLGSLAVWRYRAIAERPWEEVSPHLEFDGLERVEEAQREGRGVLLVNSHFGAGQVLGIVLARLGYSVTFQPLHDWFAKFDIRPPEGLTVTTLQGSFLARRLLEAQRVLQRGEIFLMAPDGHQGEGLTRELPFLRRVRPFSPSFAELTLLSGALAIPAFAPVEEDGTVRLDFLPPLDERPDLSDRAARVDAMLEQYVALLEGRWLSDPGNVMERHLSRYREMPFREGFSDTKEGSAR